MTKENDMPTYDEAEQVAVAILEAWNTKEYDKGVALLHEEFEVVEVATGDSYRGGAGLLAEYTKWHTGLSDGFMHIQTVIGKGELVAIETIVRGTHDGVFAGPDGDLPPTGRSIEFPMCTISTVRDGKELHERHYFDGGSLLRQLGAQG
jgi:steroid delta-isomerase-like uncharacterized protein